MIRALALAASLGLAAAQKTKLRVMSPIVDSSTDVCTDARAEDANLRLRVACDWMQANPQYEINFVKSGWGTLYGDIFEAAASADPAKQVDIAYVGSTWMLDLVDRGLIKNLQPYLNDLRLTRPRGDLTLEFARQCEMDFKIEGDYWAIPNTLSSRTLFFRRDLYQKHLGHTNPPDTMEEMWANSLVIQRGEAAEGKTVYGYTTQLQENVLQHFVPFYLGYGGSLLDRNGECGFRTKEFKEAVAVMNEMYQPGPRSIMPPSITSMPESNDLFAAGEALHQINGGWLWWTYGEQEFGNNGSTNNVGVAQTPAGPKGRFAFFGADAWAITASATHPDAAWNFIQTLMDPDGAHLEIVKKEGGISPYNRMWKHAEQSLDSVVTQVEQLPYSFSQYFPTTGNFYMPRLELEGTVGKMLRRVLLNEMSIDEAAEAACAELDTMFTCTPHNPLVTPTKTTCTPAVKVEKEFPIYVIPILAGVVLIAVVIGIMWWRKRAQANDLFNINNMALDCAANVAIMDMDALSYFDSSPHKGDPLHTALMSIVSNLRVFVNFLPGSVVAQVRGDAYEETEDQASAPPTPGRKVSVSGESKKSTEHGSLATSRKTKAAPKAAAVALALGLARKNAALAVVNVRNFSDGWKGKEGGLLEAHTAYLTALIAQVQANRGLPDGFQGDRLYASFNGARSTQGARAAAGRCALAFAEKGAAALKNDPQISAAASAESLLCGNLGVDGLKKYTFVGSAQGLVHVLENHNRAMETKVLCDTRVKNDIEQSHRIRQMLPVEHKAQQQRSYEVVMAMNAAENEWMYQLEEGAAGDTGKELSNAVDLYLKGQVDGAKEAIKADAVQSAQHTIIYSVMNGDAVVSAGSGLVKLREVTDIK